MNDDYRIEKLNGENYRHWAMRAQGILEMKGCWNTVSSGLPEEPTASQTALDHKAKSIFYMIVNDESLDDIADCETAKDIWETLQDIHTKYDTWHGLLLVKDFVSTMKKENETIGEYLSRRNALYHKVKHAGFTFEETVLAGFAVLGLPKEFEYLARSLRLDDDDLTLSGLKAKLIEEERRLKHTKNGSKEEESKAMVMKTRYSQIRGRGQTRGRYEQRNRREDRKDYTRRNSDREESLYERKDTRTTDDDRDYSYKKCYNCLEFGHIGRDCPHKRESEKKKNSEKETEKKNEAQLVTAKKHYAAYATKDEGQNKDKNEKASLSLLIFDRNIKDTCTTWVLDSGATDHMTPFRNKFVTFHKEEISVEVAGGGTLLSTGKGDVEITLDKNCGGNILTLQNTLYVPDLEGNLLSAPQMTEKGLCVKLAQNTATIRQGKQVVATGYKDERLYYFYEEPNISTKVQTNKAITKSEDLWHRRLGHLHVAAVKELSQKNAANIEIDDEKIHTTCETCMKGKLKTKPFPKKSFSRQKEPLRLIHSDVVGPIKPTSKGGNKYFVTFIDDFSRYTEVQMMKTKSQVQDKFEEYKKRVENYHEKRIIALRSDNGGEYISNSFKKLLSDHGIDRQLTIPGTPQQNGVAERANQTLLDSARCMLIESGLPTHFWADAVATAAYVRNRCPTIANESATPLELWKKKIMNLSHLKVFGCRAWAVNKRRENKLSPKGIPCIFIGYDVHAKAYRLWNQASDEIFISRDVKFDEDVFPLKTEREKTIEHRSLEDTLWCTMEIESDEDIISRDEEPVEDNESSSSGNENENDENENHEFENSEEDSSSSNDNEVEKPENTTRSGRRVIPPTWQKDFILDKDPKCNKAVINEEFSLDPLTVQQALKSEESINWKNAMLEEAENLFRNETFDFVIKPTNRKIIRGKWIFRTKYDEEGNLARYRARLVALGNTQTPGIDYDQTYAPVVQTKTTRILFGIAAERKWDIHHLDITAAYLMTDLAEDVYMQIPAPVLDPFNRPNVKKPEWWPVEVTWPPASTNEWIARVCRHRGTHMTGEKYKDYVLPDQYGFPPITNISESVT